MLQREVVSMEKSTNEKIKGEKGIFLPATVGTKVVVHSASRNTLITRFLTYVKGNRDRVLGDIWWRTALANTVPSQSILTSIAHVSHLGSK